MQNESNRPWFSCGGDDIDVVVSSRIRLSRNLANFSFPEYFRGDDGDRVQTIIFDAFSQILNEDEGLQFHAVNSGEIDSDGRLLLEERGVLERTDGLKNTPAESGVIMSTDGRFSATVNSTDHLRLSAYGSGLAVRKCFEAVRKIDEKLQKNLQFAASYDFGYLTADIRDAGSGMKLFARVFIPGVVKTGHFRDIVEYLDTYGINISPAFPQVSQGSAAGSFYQISSTRAMKGSELDQLADFEAACKFIAESERKISAMYADNKRTIVRNTVIRAYSLAKFSLLVSYGEAVEIISDIKFGLDRGFLQGIEDSQLCGLLYRVQPGHLLFLLKDGKFEFEKDIAGDQRSKIDRLRALILKEAFEKISLGNV